MYILHPVPKVLLFAPMGVPARKPWHPGYFLNKNYLLPLKLSQTQAAKLLGLSRRRLHEILHGQRSLTPDTALRLAVLFHIDASFWLALQSAWDSFQAWRKLRLKTNASISI